MVVFQTEIMNPILQAKLINIFSLDLPAFIIAIGIHEFFHAYTAYKLGDFGTVQDGRVKVNPLVHLDFLGTLLPMCLSFLGSPVIFGWGKPVKVDSTRFDNPIKGMGFTAIAGPIGNLFACILIGLFLSISPRIDFLYNLMHNSYGNYFFRFMFRLFAINAGLFLFNSLPIPPLDGSKIIMAFGGKKAIQAFEKIKPFSLLIILAIIFFKFDQLIFLPIFKFLVNLLTGVLAPYVINPSQFIVDFNI